MNARQRAWMSGRGRVVGRWMRGLMLLGLVPALLLSVGCPGVPGGGGNQNQNQNQNGNGNDNDNGDPNGNNNQNDNGNGDGDGTDSGTYDPATGLVLETDGVRLNVPPGAISTSVTLSLRRAGAADLPLVLAGNVGLAGGVFGPAGQNFLVPTGVSVTLSQPTIVPQLPVLTFDQGRFRWVGARRMADVAAGGGSVDFQLDHFSIAGVPDAVPIPGPGDTIGSMLVVSLNGVFTSQAINSDTGSMTFFGSSNSFSMSVSSQEEDDQGQIVTRTLNLSSVSVTRVDNYVIGVLGGGASYFNDGSSNEPLMGIMVMSLDGETVNISVYAATPDRVISGTLTGPRS